MRPCFFFFKGGAAWIKWERLEIYGRKKEKKATKRENSGGKEAKDAQPAGKLTAAHRTISKRSQVSAWVFEIKVLFPNTGSIGKNYEFHFEHAEFERPVGLNTAIQQEVGMWL